MEVIWNSDKNRLSAMVVVEIEGREIRIDVYRLRSLHKPEEWKPPTINWPAIGSQPIANTRLFVKGLEKAIEVAIRMSEPVHMYRVTVEQDGEVGTYDIAGVAKFEVREQIERVGARVISIEEVPEARDSDELRYHRG